jgi:hypothetical protein
MRLSTRERNTADDGPKTATLTRAAGAWKERNTNGTAGSVALKALVKDLEPLFGKAQADPELHDKLKRRVGAYLDRLFGTA